MNLVRRTVLLLAVVLLIALMLVATAAPESVVSLDLGTRRLLGIGTIALTVIVAVLMAWHLPFNREHLGQRHEKIRDTRQDSPSSRSQGGPVRQQEKRSEGRSEGAPFRVMWRRRRR